MRGGAGLAAALLALLAGCSENSTAVTSAGPIAGAAVGIGLGSVTANPLIAYAAGVGTQAGITALQKYFSRKIHQGQQDEIAASVGVLRPGQQAAWRIRFDLPIGDAQGDVTVTRVIASPLTTCKEAAFRVDAGDKPPTAGPVYLTTACRQPDGSWRWAAAEPAVSRWGFLQ